MNIEKIILANLLTNDQYYRKVIAFLKSEYFSTPAEKRSFEEIFSFFENYGSAPAESAIIIAVEKLPLKQAEIDDTKKCIHEIFAHPGGELDKWLIDETEKFCKNKALYNAIYEAIKIVDNKGNSNKSPNVIPDILRDALSISFDTQVGHEYFDDAEARFDLYSMKELKVEFDLAMMNDITEGGLSKKTLNIVLAPPGGGKSIFLCHHAAACLRQNMNVLFITCEMSEERIAERIDANLMDVEVSNLKHLSKKAFLNKVQATQKITKGKLIIKEYANSTADAMQFRRLLDDLAIKKKFIPDIIVLDYLNICESYKFKKNSTANSYTIVKSIAEEVRALAQEYDLPILTAAQFNRSGAASSDPTQENVAESAGLNHTADLMFALVSTEELEAYNQVMVKQLKNRYSDIGRNRKFLLGLDKAKMRFHDLTNPTPTPSQTTNQSAPFASPGKYTPPKPPKTFSGGSIAPQAPAHGMSHTNIFTGKPVDDGFDGWN